MWTLEISASATSTSQATVGGHAEALRGGGGGCGGGLSETLQIMLNFFVRPQRAVAEALVSSAVKKSSLVYGRILNLSQ